MMREIKFRSWLKERKEFIYKFTMDSILDSESEKYILSQYTCLKDKNSREIYEGDILQIKDHAFQRHDGDLTGIDIDGNYVVKWTENAELILTTSLENDGGWLLNKNLCYVTVIGNVYQNPELLEGMNVV